LEGGLAASQRGYVFSAPKEEIHEFRKHFLKTSCQSLDLLLIISANFKIFAEKATSYFLTRKLIFLKLRVAHPHKFFMRIWKKLLRFKNKLYKKKEQK